MQERYQFYCANAKCLIIVHVSDTHVVLGLTGCQASLRVTFRSFHFEPHGKCPHLASVPRWEDVAWLSKSGKGVAFAISAAHSCPMELVLRT